MSSFEAFSSLLVGAEVTHVHGVVKELRQEGEHEREGKLHFDFRSFSLSLCSLSCGNQACSAAAGGGRPTGGGRRRATTL